MHLQTFQWLSEAPLPPATSQKHQFSGVTGGYTKLDETTKYDCHSLISSHSNFVTIGESEQRNFRVKTRWWGKDKEPRNYIETKVIALSRFTTDTIFFSFSKRDQSKSISIWLKLFRGFELTHVLLQFLSYLLVLKCSIFYVLQASWKMKCGSSAKN